MAYRGLFITGTDTGVGKTLVTGGLAACLRKRGLRPGVLKPVETGCAVRAGRRVPRDGAFLRGMAGTDLPVERIVPYRLREPLAPEVAARREGVTLRIPRIVRALRSISASHDCVLVEGAGGLLVPVTRRRTMADLAGTLGLPVLLVARLGLGTLNHTLLSLFYLRQRALPVVGIVLSAAEPGGGQAAQTNPSVLARWSPVPILGVLPHRKGLRPIVAQGPTIARMVETRVHLDPLLQACAGGRA